MKQNSKIIINCSSELHALIKKRAEENELRMGPYCRLVLKNAVFRIERSERTDGSN